jgi:methyl-accepting chemotaxis protein
MTDAESYLGTAIGDVATALKDGEHQSTVTMSIAGVGEALEDVASSIGEIHNAIRSYRDNEPSLSDAICQVGRAVREELEAQAVATDRLAAAMERIAAALEKK